MKLKAEIDPVSLLKTAQQCRGAVIFKTTEGDRLDLKSALSSYVLCAILGAPEIVYAGYMECSDPEDYRLLMDFLEDG